MPGPMVSTNEIVVQRSMELKTKGESKEGAADATRTVDGLGKESVKVSDMRRWFPCGCFNICSKYNLLPSSANLVMWGKTDDDACHLCSKRQILGYALSTSVWL